MSIFRNIANSFRAKPPKTEERSTVTGLTDYLRNGYPSTSKGINISARDSLGISYVYAAASGIASDLASLDWGVFHEVDGKQVADKEHDQYKLITKRPYFAYKAVDFRRAWVLNYLLTGDGYAEIIRSARYGRPLGYRLHHKHNIEPYINHDTQKLTYVLTESIEIDGVEDESRTVQRDIDSRDMLHLSDLSLNGIAGLSKIALMRKTLEISSRSDDTQNDIQKNGTFLGGAIEIDATLKPEQLEKFRTSFKNVYGGSKGEIGVLDAGAKFTPFAYSMTLADAEFIASRRFTGEEILRFFRYPSHKALNLDGSATKSNMESMNIEYVHSCLRPIAVMMECELTDKIFRPKKDKDHYVKADLNSLLRGDTAARMAMYETMHKVGAMSANKILSIEGHNPIANGDETYVDLNTVPASMAKEYYKSKIDTNNEGKRNRGSSEEE